MMLQTCTTHSHSSTTQRWHGYYKATLNDVDIDPIFEQTAIDAKKIIPGKHLTALDLGCGTGKIALMLAQRGWTVTASDQNLSALQILQQRAQEAHLAITTKQQNICDNLGTQKYDLLTAGKLLSFIDPRTHSLNTILETNIFPIIKSNGWIIADFFGTEHTWCKTKKNITPMNIPDLKHIFSSFAQCEIYENIDARTTKEGGLIKKWHEITVVAKNMLTH